MYHREMEPILIELATQYPVVTVTGPRQSGKTTLTRKVFADKPYANLEAPDIRHFAAEDPRRFLAQYPDGVILDEIQRAPELLSYIQVLVDEKNKPGQYILTGSHQLSLHQAVSQSLAGRTALLTLLPLTLQELAKNGFVLDVDQQLLNGFYPRIYQESLDPATVYRNYYHTYVERDVREIVNIKNLVSFERFIKLCAGRIGNLLDMTSLANDVGVSVTTISNWLSILEASYLIVRLQPYYENVGKRMIKSPKLYFTDVGFAAYLLGIENVTQMSRDPLRGALFENMVVIELMKYRFNQGKDAPIYFYRDNHKNEIDVVVKLANHLIPVEIKSAQTFHSDFLKGLKFLKNTIENRIPVGYVVYSGANAMQYDIFHVINYQQATRIWGGEGITG
jgi:predicted AAA+ superfamily ATPase